MFAALLEPGNYTFSAFAIPTLVTTVAVLCLGAAAILRERASSVSLVFGLLTLSIAVWQLAFTCMYCAVDRGVALWWAKAAYLGVPFIPAAVFHFTVSVLRLHDRFGRLVMNGWLVAAVFAGTIIGTDTLINDLYRYWWGYYPRYGWLSVPYLVFFFGLMIESLRLYWAEYRDAAPGTKHQERVRALLVGFSVVFLGSFDYLAKYGVPLYPFGFLPVLVFVGLTARALRRHRLIDITPALAATQIIETMHEGVLVLDLDGVVRVANRTACRMLRRPHDALIGTVLPRAHKEFLDPERFARLSHDAAAEQLYEVRLPTDSGDVGTLSVSPSMMRDEEGRAVAIVCIARDITGHKRDEQVLRQAFADLNDAHAQVQQTQLQLIHAAKMESIGRLAAGVAHEVKNPLSTVRMGLDCLADYFTSGVPAVHRLLEDMQQAVLRADAVIRGLLDFSSPRRLERRPADVNAIIAQALDLTKHGLDRCQIRVVQILDAVPRLSLDRIKIAQALVNVFMNAQHAMPQGGVLTIRTRQAPGPDGAAGVVLEVDDTGSGVPEDQLEKVFDPFFTTKATGMGTGLGLTVTKTIVELHGGEITMANRPHGGVRVTMQFRGVDAEVPDGEAARLAH